MSVLIGDYYVGKTHMIVRAEEISEEEKQAILKRIGEKAAMALQAEANRKQIEANKKHTNETA